jgi:hypothetical protein
MAGANPLRQLGCSDIVDVCACLVNRLERERDAKRAGVFSTATSVASRCFYPAVKENCASLQHRKLTQRIG